jgi:photosynthetic reaction center cytochrome c subunit
MLGFATIPFLVAFKQEPITPQAPTCEQVYKNIKVFKGVPASDLIPAMEFMSASLNYECTDCHDPKDYSVDTRTKDTAREMVLMQRDIDTKNFNGRNQVTCMTCHRGSEHPVGTPIMPGVAFRHERTSTTLKPEDIFAMEIAAAGGLSAPLVRTGTLTAPNDATHKIEKTPLEFVQTEGGKYRLVANDRKIGSDGSHTWYGGYPMTDEPAATFERMGRAWRSKDAFAGLQDVVVSGQDKIGKADVIVIRGSRPSTSSTEELYFESKTNLLLRMVNIRPSPLGNVVSSIDYSNYKPIKGAKVPMKVVATFAGGGSQWIMEFKDARLDPSIGDAAFVMGKS